MDKLEYCKYAHEHKDKIMEMMMNDEPITRDHLLMFIAYSEVCRQNIMEMQRETVWQPLNDQLRQADGVHTVMIDSDSEFVKAVQMHGKDLSEAVHHALKMVSAMKDTDPVAYSKLMAQI